MELILINSVFKLLKNDLKMIAHEQHIDDTQMTHSTDNNYFIIFMNKNI